MRKVLFAVLVVLAVALAGRAFATLDTPPTTSPRDQRDDRTVEPTDTAFIAWVHPESVAEGTVFHVRPTRAGRLADRAELDLAWEQAVDQGVPNRATLRHQFLCHPLSVVARAKPTWDLESWRPDVGGLRTMLLACNP